MSLRGQRRCATHVLLSGTNSGYPVFGRVIQTNERFLLLEGKIDETYLPFDIVSRNRCPVVNVQSFKMRPLRFLPQRKGKIDEAFRSFKRIYLKMVDDIVAHLEAHESSESIDWGDRSANRV